MIHYDLVLMAKSETENPGIKLNQVWRGKFMIRWKNSYWIALGSSSIASGMHLVVNADALAHGGSHGQEGEPATASAAGKHHAPRAETTATGASSTALEPLEADTMAMPSAEVPMDATDDASMQELPAAQESLPASVSNASVSGGFSIGLGESLLGLIIAGPLLLISLKKQLQS